MLLAGVPACLSSFMRGFDAKLDRLIFGEPVALLHTAQSRAAESHPCHRLKQLAVTFPGTTLTKPFE